MYKVAIHQPNYLPWLGYFYKIWLADVFIFHDRVEYTKRSFIKRVQIRTISPDMPAILLSVPLCRHSDFALIADLQIDHTQNWQAKHLNLLKNHYAKSPNFSTVLPMVAAWLQKSKDITTLADWNIFLISAIFKYLNVSEKKFLRSSEIVELSDLKADAYNLALAQYCNATTYISGIGAKKYQSDALWANANIALQYSDFGKFLTLKDSESYQPNGFSVLDALFWQSPTAIIALFEAAQRWEVNASL
jgi:hypothetical protein